MNKKNEIAKLFSKSFKCDNLLKPKGGCAFICPYKSKCGVDVKNDPIWTPFIGDENSKVMIVAETPSTAGGVGVHIAGTVEAQMKLNNKSPLNDLFKFVHNEYKTFPYFTDVVKCGFKNEVEKRLNFKRRLNNCIEHFLIEEINIQKPKVIICVGSKSKKSIDKLVKENKIDHIIKIIHLLHYSRNANLPLTSIDKIEIVWPFQTGNAGINIASKLNFFNNKMVQILNKQKNLDLK